MLTLKQLSSDKTEYSTTRWAFCLVIIFDIIVISCCILSYLTFHFIGKSIDLDFFKNVAVLLGILTTLVSTVKFGQGFEPRTDKPKVEEK